MSALNLPLDLTIAIPVRNEDILLDRCLSAIGADFARRIVVIDSHSTDSTISIAHSYSVDVIQFDWNGRFPKKRNWFLEHHSPMTTWVMFLDADEILTSAAKREIASVLPNATQSGFSLTFANYFLGHRLYGGYPLRKLALFRVGCGKYQMVDDDYWSSCDMEVHEHVILTGSVGVIRSCIDHRDDRGIDHYMRKHLEYAAWESSRIVSRSSSRTRLPCSLSKQHFKSLLLSTPWGGLVFFMLSYFIYGGWRDGSRGFAFCFLKAAYFVQVSCRVLEMTVPPTSGPVATSRQM